MSDAIKDWSAIVGWSTANAKTMPSLRVLSHIKGSLSSRRKWARACFAVYGVKGLADYLKRACGPVQTSILHELRTVPILLSAVELRELLIELGGANDYTAETGKDAKGQKVERLRCKCGSVAFQRNGRDPWKIVI